MEIIGIHIRNDGFLDRQHTEFMFQFLGVALQAPVTESTDFTWQLIFQPDIEWGR